MNEHKVKIAYNKPGDVTVEIDGKDIVKDGWLKSVSLYLDADSFPILTVTHACDTVVYEGETTIIHRCGISNNRWK